MCVNKSNIAKHSNPVAFLPLCRIGGVMGGRNGELVHERNERAKRSASTGISYTINHSAIRNKNYSKISGTGIMRSTPLRFARLPRPLKRALCDNGLILLILRRQALHTEHNSGVHSGVSFIVVVGVVNTCRTGRGRFGCETCTA
jgi:hypothetical protein